MASHFDPLIDQYYNEMRVIVNQVYKFRTTYNIVHICYKLI